MNENGMLSPSESQAVFESVLGASPIRESVSRKILAVLKHGATSDEFAAILGCLLNQHWTEPRIEELIVTSDGWLLARVEGDIGANDFLGKSIESLHENLGGIAKAGNLTEEETAWLLSLAPNDMTQ